MPGGEFGEEVSVGGLDAVPGGAFGEEVSEGGSAGVPGAESGGAFAIGVLLGRGIPDAAEFGGGGSTLWFLDRGKAKGKRADQVLFLDARHLFRQVTRAHRTFDADQVEFLATNPWIHQPFEGYDSMGAEKLIEKWSV